MTNTHGLYNSTTTAAQRPGHRREALVADRIQLVLWNHGQAHALSSCLRMLNEYREKRCGVWSSEGVSVSLFLPRVNELERVVENEDRRLHELRVLVLVCLAGVDNHQLELLADGFLPIAEEPHAPFLDAGTLVHAFELRRGLGRHIEDISTSGFQFVESIIHFLGDGSAEGSPISPIVIGIILVPFSFFFC